MTSPPFFSLFERSIPALRSILDNPWPSAYFARFWIRVLAWTQSVVLPSLPELGFYLVDYYLPAVPPSYHLGLAAATQILLDSSLFLPKSLETKKFVFFFFPLLTRPCASLLETVPQFALSGRSDLSLQLRIEGYFVRKDVFWRGLSPVDLLHYHMAPQLLLNSLFDSFYP